MSARLVEPGTVLADRYLVEDMLAEEGPSASWRAHDQILSRSVVLQMVPSSSASAGRLLASAKKASRVADPRILQVLDAVDDGELAYVVREWASGQSLDVVLAEGPLPSRRAAWLVREIAGAIASAHSLGVAHQRLAPDTVVLASSNGVKIIGLGTFAALGDDFGVEDAEHEDTVALGKLLYACLTARWPGGDCPSLPAAPTEHGQLLRPRQVRAGVPRALDAICERVLSGQPRYGAALTTAAEVKDQLTSLLAHDLHSRTAGITQIAPAHPALPSAVDPPPALLPREVSGRPSADPPPPSAGSSLAGKSAERRASPGKTLVWPAVAVLVLGVMLLAYLVGQGGVDRPQQSAPPSASSGSPSQTPTPPPPLRPLQIAASQSFDPYPGSGDEHPELVPLAYDGDTSTVWETQTYFGNPALGGQKDGVGLLLDLGSVQEVRSVEVVLQGTGTSLELRATPPTATVAPSQSAQDYRLVSSVAEAGIDANFRLRSPVPTRYLLVWLTALPPEDAGSYRGRVAEVRVYG